jgi:Trypsin-like peptidase domain
MRRRAILTFALSATLAASLPTSQISAALVPPGFLNCVVALGFSVPTLQNGAMVQMWHTVGTGFFYGYLTTDDPDILKRLYNVHLVTAKHVVASYRKMQIANPSLGPLKVRVNPVESGQKGTEFDLIQGVADPNEAWADNPKGKDVSVIPVNVGFLRENKYQSQFFENDTKTAGIDKMKELEVNAGDGIFVLGFPMDRAGKERNYVIVRHGIIARISEILDRASDTFMIDSLVYPGNSGGPVILKPEIVSISGTKSNSNAYLIGLVISYIPYQDLAVSTQTGEQRIMFEENSGLAEVLPIDSIDETIKAALADKK